jgi:hypothetical protein
VPEVDAFMLRRLLPVGPSLRGVIAAVLRMPIRLGMYRLISGLKCGREAQTMPVFDSMADQIAESKLSPRILLNGLLESETDEGSPTSRIL